MHVRGVRSRAALLLVLSVVAGGLVPPGTVSAATATPGATFTAAGPVRVLDTRSGVGAARARVVPGDGIVLTVPSLPANASGVVLNLTATGLTGATDTFVSACPAAQSVASCRTTSVLNPVPGATVTNEITVPVAADGRVRLLDNAGAIDLVADLAGYVSTGYAPAGPVRVLDTRSGTGAAQARVVPGDGIVLTVPSLPANASGVVLNLTATGLTGATDTFVSACPAAQSVASCRTTSVLNPVPGATVTNEITVPVAADGRVRLLDNAGAIDLVADVAGAYVPRPGNDVSYPQCASSTSSQTGPLPSGQTFGVVGVNNGLANTTNPCFAAELSWARGSAGGTGQPTVALYVNTANPGAVSASWPTSNTDPGGAPVSNPYGTCTVDPSTNRGADTAACAYVYGYSRAHDDVTQRLGGEHAADFSWWLDVETTSSWAGVDESTPPRTPSPSATTANLADLEGMTAYLRGTGATVGVYSSGYQWGLITGSIPPSSPLRGAPSWLAGYSSVAAARTGCVTGQPLVGGRVTMTQYEDTSNPSNRVDHDVSCT